MLCTLLFVPCKILCSFIISGGTTDQLLCSAETPAPLLLYILLPFWSAKLPGFYTLLLCWLLCCPAALFCSLTALLCSPAALLYAPLMIFSIRLLLCIRPALLLCFPATLLFSLVLCSHLPSCSLFSIFCCYVLLYSLLLCSAPFQHALHYGNLFIPLRVCFSLLPCFSGPMLALLFFYTYSTPKRVCSALLLLYSPAPLLLSTPMLTLLYFFIAMFYSTPCCSALLPCCMLCHFGPQRLCSAPLLQALPLQ